MGYLLPIQPIQSQQYANRMAIEPYNFASINRVQTIKFQTDFLKASEENMDKKQEERKQDQEKKQERSNSSSVPSELTPYIYPNPANLSPEISKVVGKGISFNTYA